MPHILSFQYEINITISERSGVVVHACNPSNSRSRNWKDQGLRSSLGRKCKTHLKNNESKRDWECGSSGRVPAWQVSGLEVISQYHQIIIMRYFALALY
jgi:hypothetical protein